MPRRKFVILATFWVNRLKQPAEEFSVTVDGIGKDLLDLEDFVFAS